jgi:hypothetical protein
MHDRKLVFGIMGLIQGRAKNINITLPSIRDRLEQMIIDSNCLEKAPFKWVDLLFMQGEVCNLKVKFGRINKKYGDVSVSVELKMEILQWADKNNVPLLGEIYTIATLEALIQVAQKYDLPCDVFIKERAQYGAIPETVEECEKYVTNESNNI